MISERGSDLPGLDGADGRPMTPRVLVTGATGFVGRAVVPLLQKRGFEVHAVGRTEPLHSGLTFHAADLLASAQVSTVVAAVRASHLLHLAWYAEPGLYWKSARNLDWVAASLHLVRGFAEAGGRRVVVAGTCAEYEWGSPRFYETQSACVPATLYGAAKDGLRRLLEAYAEVAGLSLAWGRIFYLYGPCEKPGRLVSDAIQRLLAGERFPTSEGRQKRDFLHIADAAAAFATLLDGSVGGPVNIGSGTSGVRPCLAGNARRGNRTPRTARLRRAVRSRRQSHRRSKRTRAA